MARRDVLIVEEDSGVRWVFREIFVAAGYNCLLASDGAEGLEVFRRSRPQLIVTDLKMPMVKGGERVPDAGIRLLLEIRSEDPDAAVIVASGSANVKTVIESLKLGAHDFLMKPVNMDELLLAAERALERRQLLIERRQHQQAFEQLQDSDRPTPGRAEVAHRDVLIVEDDRQVREVLHQIFVSAGYNCLLAHDGREGVEVFKARRPQLVVTELRMSGVTGVELLQQVRAVDDAAAVIALTSASDVKTAIASLKLGAHDFVVKPVNVDELLIATERALERRQLLIERRKYHELLEEVRRKNAEP